MFNPLDFVTQQDIEELGLTPEELNTSYQPSSGGVFHCRGAEGKGKTLWGAHLYRYLVDINKVSPYNAVGNLTFKGKYGIGWQTLKSDDLRQYLWDMTHKPYRNKFVFIDEIDSEFPARSFPDKEQTEISLRLWHIQKLGNYVVMTSHLGNSTDLIIHLAAHFIIIPHTPNFETNLLDYDIINKLDNEVVTDLQATDIIKTMLIYNRAELTEQTEEEQNKIRPSLLRKQKQEKRQKQEIIINDSIDNIAEWKGLTL